MKYTIAVITDEYSVECYGQLSNRQDAEGTAARFAMQTNVDVERGDVGYVRFQVCKIQPLKDFQP